MRCSFCHGAQASVSKLIASPGKHPHAYICEQCVAVCKTKIMEGHADLAPTAQAGPSVRRWGPFSWRREPAGPRCSFCEKAQKALQRITASPDGRVYVCNECVEVCCGILAQGATLTKPEGARVADVTGRRSL